MDITSRGRASREAVMSAQCQHCQLCHEGMPDGLWSNCDCCCCAHHVLSHLGSPYCDGSGISRPPRAEAGWQSSALSRAAPADKVPKPRTFLRTMHGRQVTDSWVQAADEAGGAAFGRPGTSRQGGTASSGSPVTHSTCALGPSRSQ